MPNKNYLAGRRIEYQRMKHWKSLKHEVLRTTGSHGFADLITVSMQGYVYFIQCKRVQTKAHAERLIKEFKTNPPLGHRYAAEYHQIIEVSVKELRGQVLSGCV